MKICTFLKTVFFVFIFITPSFIVRGQWHALNGPDGAYIRSIHFDGQHIYAASGGGVLVSNSQGNTWSFQNAGLKSCDTKSITSLGAYVFVSTDENVFRTKNAGIDWETAGCDLDGKYVKHLLRCKDTLFAATYLHGIYRSSDTGNTWQAVNSGFTAKYAYYLATDGLNVYAATYKNGIFRSADMGNTWSPINNGLPELDIMSICCVQNKVFLSTLTSGVFVSEDTGNTWYATSTVLPSIKGFNYVNGQLYAVSMGSGVFVSTDLGQSWTQINSGLAELNLWSIASSNTDVYVGTNNGNIYQRSNTGGSWSQCISPDFDACVGSLCSSGGNLLAGSHGSGFFASTNAGDDWTRIASIWTVETRAVIASNQYVFAGTDMLGVFKSSNNGGSFTMSNTGLTSAWIQAFAICQGKLFAGSGEEGVFISHDAGNSWAPVNTGLHNLNVLSLADDSLNVYAATDSGVYVTSNLGNSWQLSGNGLLNHRITALDYAHGNLFAAVKNYGMFRSDDGGQNWNQLTSGIPAQASIRCLHIYDSLVFCGTDEGEVFASFDLGANWFDQSFNLSAVAVLSLFVYNNYLYAGMNAGGVWKIPLSQISNIDGRKKSVEVKIYPNPVANKLRISGADNLKESKYSILGVSGREVFNGQFMQDNPVLDIEFLPSGLYTLKIESDVQVFSVKFVKK